MTGQLGANVRALVALALCGRKDIVTIQCLIREENIAKGSIDDIRYVTRW